MWENQQMFDYLENPKKYIKGTNMVRRPPPPPPPPPPRRAANARVGASMGERSGLSGE